MSEGRPGLLRDPLLPEEVLAAADDRVRQRMRNSGEQWLIEADDERLGPAFRRYLLFARWPELLGDDAPELDAERRLYNTYYWLKRLSHLYMAEHGFDAGMEQQAFQLLEYPDVEVDWSAMERIDQQAQR